MIAIDETFGDELRDLVGAAEGDLDGYTDRTATRELERTLASVLPRIEAVRALVGDADPERRRSGCVAFEALARAGWNDIWSLLGQDDEDEVRGVVTAMLPSLCAATCDPIATVRAAAATALGVVRWSGSAGARAEESLVAALADPVAEVRAAAVASLARRLPERSAAIVAKLTVDETPVVEEEVLRCLLAAESDDAVPLLVRVARREREGRALSWSRFEQLRSIALPAVSARELALPHLDPAVDADVRCQAAALLVEYADVSCVPALRRTLAVGDHGAVCAALALARLGAAIPVEDLLPWLDPRANPQPRQDLVQAATYALAASGRRELGAALFAHARGDLDGDEPTMRSGSMAVALGVLGVQAAIPSLSRIVAAEDSAWEYVRAPAAIALGLVGGAAEAQQLAALARRDDGRDRLRLSAALGRALIDRDVVDDDVVDGAASGWPARVATFEDDMLPFAFALRALGQRMSAPLSSLSPPMTWLVDRALEVLAGLDEARDAALRCHRGRGPTSGLSTGYTFLIGDLLDEGEAALLRVRHGLPAFDAEVASLVDDAAAEIAAWDDAAWGRQPAGPPPMQVLVDWLEERGPRPSRPALVRLLRAHHRRRRASVA